MLPGDRFGRHSLCSTTEPSPAHRPAHLGHVGSVKLPSGTDPVEYLGWHDGTVDVFHANHEVPLIVARVEDTVARQGDAIQWAEGRVGALRKIARYLATYPPDSAARQVVGVAATLGFDR
jgi:hypothetical protein